MYRVLLVDDEHIILKGLMRVIAWDEYGCEVVGTACDGKEGIAMIEKLKPHILLTDIRMPNMDGLKMLAAIKSTYPHMQITVLTAFREFEYAQKAITLGVSRYLLKPSRMDELKEALLHMTSTLDRLSKSGKLSQNEKNEDADDTDTSAASSSFIVKSAMQYIEQHCTEKLNLQMVADHVYVSQWHLSKLINRHQNKNFFDIVNQLRIDKSKELLKDPALKVHQIAEQVGYSDVAHFSKIFKKLVGQSPIEYRSSL